VTPAGRLRAAANTIEGRAHLASPGPWYAEAAENDDTHRVRASYTNGGRAWFTAAEGCTHMDAAHIALWDPPTTRYAATLLRTIAGYVDEADRLGLTVVEGDLTTSALALADAILTEADVPA
jgi:hypothetical protein